MLRTYQMLLVLGLSELTNENASENFASVPVAGYSWLIEASAICIPGYNVVDSDSSPVGCCVNRCSFTL